MSTRFFFVTLLILAGLTGAEAFGNNDEGKPSQSSVEVDSTAILLNEIRISAGYRSPRNSPLRLSSIDDETIRSNAHGQTYPELLKEIPGIYATCETGSYGDARINIRGFKQENISVLLNGIPISGLTSGSMFWNNWLGLTDATETIQVQKGIGASMLSDNSVGGTINIITRSPMETSSIGIGYNYTSYGLSKGSFNYNSGNIGNGWGIMLIGSYTWGHGYVECTDVNAGSFLLSVSKKINSKHSLLFTTLGSPERHQQRSQRLTYDEIGEYGVNYNKNWGLYTNENGEIEAKTISENNYFKPYFTLNHFFSNNRNFTLNSAVYLTVGDGGGIWTESKGQRIISYQDGGHIDWNAIIAENKQLAANGEGASNILSNYMAGHTQFGVTSNFIWDLNEKTSIEGGIHYQHYTTWEKEQITDLLGGDYWIEDYASNSLAGIAGRESKKVVGDYIRTHNGKILNYGTLYGVLNHRGEKLVVNLGLSLNGSTHKRWDKYNYYGGDIYSKTAVGIGGSFKGGILYKASRQSSFYINAAAYSRVPYSSVFFASGNNQISEDVKNEKNLLGELGYRYVTDKGAIEGTLYAAYWFNKSLLSNPYQPLDENEAYSYMITGLDAFHIGLEVDAYYNVSRWMRISARASIGNWKWKNDVRAKIYDPYTDQVVEEVNVYCNGLPVGDAPQTQIGADIEIMPFKYCNSGKCGILNNLTVSAGWNFADRYWAEFEPNTRTDEEDTANPYRIPSYHLVNLGIKDNFKVGRHDISLYVTVNNLFNSRYIVRGKDGSLHNRDTFTGYWGAKRYCVAGIEFRF